MSLPKADGLLDSPIQDVDLLNLSYAEAVRGGPLIDLIKNWPWRDLLECDCIVEALVGLRWEGEL